LEGSKENPVKTAITAGIDNITNQRKMNKRSLVKSVLIGDQNSCIFFVVEVTNKIKPTTSAII